MSDSHCNLRISFSPQDQSPLFNRLPAEIRNKIHTYVFTRNTAVFTKYQSRQSRRSPHQLCFLSTCKRIHSEARILAFNTYTFPLPSSMHPTYTNLRNVVAHLSATYLSSITCLSLLSSKQPAEYLTNALLVFPALRYFTVQEVASHRAYATPGRCRRSHASVGLAYPTGVCNELITRRPENRAVARYAPHAITALVHAVASGPHKWQTGEKWRVEWPQLESSYMYTKIQFCFNELEEDLVMDTDALSAIEGVEICGCGCGDVSWTGADLVQEGGRRVHVRMVYCRKVNQHGYDESLNKYLKTRLIPGTTPASSVVAEHAGIRYEPDEAYWEGMRRKNGDLGALCRGLWRRAMAFENGSDLKLTGQGREAADLV